MPFSYESFVEDVRAAARSEHATKAVRAVLADVLADQDLLKSGLPAQDEDEIHLFEDDTVSIWSCRFDPAFLMPPHEHKMDVHIGVVSGAEKNIMFRRTGERLEHVKTVAVEAGNVLSIGADGLHAVSAEGHAPSHALHVYLGPLTQIKRDLFDWETGNPVDFTMENFDEMKRRSEDFPQY